MALPVTPKPAHRLFHQARWVEPIIFELSVTGERALLVQYRKPAGLAAPPERAGTSRARSNACGTPLSAYLSGEPW